MPMSEVQRPEFRVSVWSRGHLSSFPCAFASRVQELEKEYDALKENDPAELQRVVDLTQVFLLMSLVLIVNGVMDRMAGC